MELSFHCLQILDRNFQGSDEKVGNSRGGVDVGAVAHAEHVGYILAL